MQSFEIEGKLLKKFEIENKTATFQTREFVIEVPDGSYPQFIKFQMTQDRCTHLDSYEKGESIKVHFDLRGREWQGKYFTNLNAWRIEKAGATQPKQQPTASDNFDFPVASDEPNADNDDLPF
jgi:hypothetical protein